MFSVLNNVWWRWVWLLTRTACIQPNTDWDEKKMNCKKERLCFLYCDVILPDSIISFTGRISGNLILFLLCYHKNSHFHNENAINCISIYVKNISYISQSIQLCARRVIWELCSSYEFLAKTYSALAPTPSMIKFSICCQSICFRIRGILLLLGRFF